MKKVNIAIFGVGRIGKIHLKNLLRFPGVSVVAVADTHYPAEEFK